MPFNHLLFESLLPGRTLAEDKEKGCRSSANLERGPGEAVLLFRLDQIGTKERLNLRGKKCCDHLFFYKSGNQTLLIFIELKSTDIRGAMEQITSAHDAILSESQYFRSKRPTVCAVFVSVAASTNDKKRMQKEMREKGINLEFGTSRGKACPIKETLSNFFR